MEDLDQIVPDDIPESLTVTLRKPVSLGDQSYTQLALREPTAAEWQQWSKLEGVEADIMAVSIVSGTPKPVVDRIGARDLMTAARYLARFLG